MNIGCLELLAKDGDFDVIGIDWTTDPVEARKRVGPNVTLQGNMDPCAMFESKVSKELRKKVVKIGNISFNKHL